MTYSSRVSAANSRPAWSRPVPARSPRRAAGGAPASPPAPAGAARRCGSGPRRPPAGAARPGCPDPHVGGQLVLGHADQPARQPGRRPHLAGGRDVDPVVPERAGDEGRDGHERRARLQADQVGGQRHLGGVELAVPGHPEERFLDRQRQEGQVHPFRPDLPAGQPGGPVIGPAGQGQRHAHRHDNHYQKRVPSPPRQPRRAPAGRGPRSPARPRPWSLRAAPRRARPRSR